MSSGLLTPSTVSVVITPLRVHMHQTKSSRTQTHNDNEVKAHFTSKWIQMLNMSLKWQFEI